jgi:hypothetical protein
MIDSAAQVLDLCPSVAVLESGLARIRASTSLTESLRLDCMLVVVGGKQGGGERTAGHGSMLRMGACYE